MARRLHSTTTTLSPNTKLPSKKSKSFTSMTRNTRFYRERRRKRVRFWAIMLRVLVASVFLFIVGIVFVEILQMEQLSTTNRGNVALPPGGDAVEQTSMAPQQPPDQVSELLRRVAMLESEYSMQEGRKAQLQEQVRALSEENADLKAELLYFERMVAEATREEGINIRDVRMQRGKRRNEWRYRIVLVQGANPKKDFVGTVRVIAQTKLPNGNFSEPIILQSSGKEDPNKPLAVQFRYYKKVEASVFVPEGRQIDRLSVSVYRSGSQEPLISRSINVNVK